MGASDLQREVRRRLDELAATTEFGQADALWGRLTLFLLRETAHPEKEHELAQEGLGGAWGKLCQCFLDQKHGRWSHIHQRLRPELTFAQRRIAAGGKAAWAGRAANFLLLAATRTDEDETAAACFRWVNWLAAQSTAAEALLGQAYHYYGHHAVERQQFVEAEQRLTRSRDIFEALPRASAWRAIGLSQVLDTLGEFYTDVGDFDRARAAFRHSVDLKGELDDRYGQAISHGQLGRLYLRSFRLDEALAELQDDLRISGEIGDQHGESVTLITLAHAHLIAAEAANSNTAGHLTQAVDYLQRALALCERIGNELGYQLARMGLARHHLLQPNLLQNDINLAIDLASAAEQWIAAHVRQPPLRSAAGVWLGWAQAKNALNEQQLRDVHSRYFIPAIEALRSARLPFELAEARFQGARVFFVEGPRVGMDANDVHRQVIERLCEAIEGVNSIGARALAARYLAMAKVISPQAWLDTVLQHKRTVDQLAQRYRDVRAVAEHRFNSLRFTAHDLAQPMLRLRSECERNLRDDPAASAWRIMSAELERIRSIQNMLAAVEFVDAGESEPARAVRQKAQDTDLQPVIAEVCHALQTIYGEFGVEVAFECGAARTWRTVPGILQTIVFNLAENAAKAAANSKTQDRRVEIRCESSDSMLMIKFRNTGKPLKLEGRDVVFQPYQRHESGYPAAAGSQGLGLYLARFYTGLLNGELGISNEPPSGWAMEFVLYLRSIQENHDGPDGEPP